MKFNICRTSDNKFKSNTPIPRAQLEGKNSWTIELVSLAELVEFASEVGEPLIITVNSGAAEIEVYDNYRE